MGCNPDILENIVQRAGLQPMYYINICIKKCTERPVNDATEGSTQVAPMCASCVLPKKVGQIVLVSVQFSLEENDGFLPTMY